MKQRQYITAFSLLVMFGECMAQVEPEARSEALSAVSGEWSVRDRSGTRWLVASEHEGLETLAVYDGRALIALVGRRGDQMALVTDYGVVEGTAPLVVSKDFAIGIDSVTLRAISPSTLERTTSGSMTDLGIQIAYDGARASGRVSTRPRAPGMTTWASRCNALADRLDECDEASNPTTIGGLLQNWARGHNGTQGAFDQRCNDLQQESNLASCPQ